MAIEVFGGLFKVLRDVPPYVSIRQHTSAYDRIRQHTSAYVSIRQHTSVYVSIRLLSYYARASFLRRTTNASKET